MRIDLATSMDDRSHSSCGLMFGHSPSMLRVFHLIRAAAASLVPVLILGETGTGKELVARSIHALSSNANKPFVPVDCPSLPPPLIESELFGYVRGAFTGAVTSRMGLFRSADGGTLLLDEIGDLPTQLQANLLRAIDTKEVRPIGGASMIPFSARLLAATNRDLVGAVRAGHFRADLYYRLNVLRIELPPLRDRRTDIPIIAEHILIGISRQMDRIHARDIPRLAPEALEMLTEYDWPGNVRELRNCLERALLGNTGPVIERDDIDFGMCLNRGLANATEVNTPIRELEKAAVVKALAAARGNRALTAQLLGIGKTTLYRWLRKYDLEPVPCPR